MRPTDGRTGTPSYRDAGTHLKEKAKNNHRNKKKYAGMKEGKKGRDVGTKERNEDSKKDREKDKKKENKAEYSA